MSSNFLFSSKTTPFPTTKPLTSFPPHSPSVPSSQCISFKFNPRHNLPPPISVTSPSIPFPQPQPGGPSVNVDYLQSEFGSHDGVSFTELGSNYVIKLVHENGSAASILLPTGLITSYKPKMWHGSSAEVLHTSVSEGIAGPTIKGGVSLDLSCQGDDGFSWAPSHWVLNDVKGGPQDCFLVEMISTDSAKSVEIKHSITLNDDTLSSEISVSNLTSSAVRLTGSVLSHLTVSTPDATYAYGLERSNFFNRPQLVSDLTIVPPNLEENKESWPLSSLTKLFSAQKKYQGETQEEEVEGEEDENYKQLNEKMSKIYTCAPRSFTIIDRGKRNSVIVGRRGFQELYLYSPGSGYEEYGEYSYVCVGQSAVLKPITLPPHQQWIGEQQLHNPNN